MTKPSTHHLPRHQEYREIESMLSDWFVQLGWSAFPFQRTVWRAAVDGKSGLLHATTGAGKTYAVWLAAIARARLNGITGESLRVLWITPMRALASDTARALEAPLSALHPVWKIGLRTGDTSSTERARQQRRMPATLVTTPESLSLMLSRPDAQKEFAGLDMVIVDEWHELIASKRGVQVQLALARLRQWLPDIVTWGLSATLGDLPLASSALLGPGTDTERHVLIQGDDSKEIVVDTLLPEQVARFPWAGHLGLQMLPAVIAEIESCRSTLVFTNTRSQSELWYQHILEARPNWAGLIALHHGSLDKSVRDWVEVNLREGHLKAVVCTASLDLGVDFTPVERVLQIGSAKGIARLLQRAGRSGHSPGRISRVTLVPTHSLEILEAAGARLALERRQIESQTPPDKPFDVLVQHLITIALGGGFRPAALYREIRQAWSFRDMSEAEWEWALDFAGRGGDSLIAYPAYRRIEPDAEGVYRVMDTGIARRHRMNIGTIVAEASMQVQFLRGARLGSIEESFISRLHPGDTFLFGGRMLEFVRLKEMTVYVRRATHSKGAIPRWAGGRMPLSSELSMAVLERLKQAAGHDYRGPEMQAIAPLLELQQRWSALPTSDTLLIELLHTREGDHLLVYPFAGRSVHIGLASLLAYRLASRQAATFSISVNDYGFELLAADSYDYDALLSDPDSIAALLSTNELLIDTLSSLNAGELSQRRFREIARVSGLLMPSFPGQARSARQLQASSSLFFEVFRKHDPGNLLLVQAQREVLEQELELSRLTHTLTMLQQRRCVVRHIERPTPFALPLMVERFREKLSTETLNDRIARMVQNLEKAANR